MLPERFWKRFNKTICKLFRAGAGYFRTVRKCVKGGYSLSRKRVSPFATPERKDEGPSPSTPHIASLQLEELQRLPNRVRCTWLRHESPRFVTSRNRALLREARVTVTRRQTACGRHCCARRIVETGGKRKLLRTPTRWAERHPQGVCRIRKAAEPPTAAQQRLVGAEANRIAASSAATPRYGQCNRQALQLFELLACNANAFLLDGHTARFLSRERKWGSVVLRRTRRISPAA